MRVIRWGQLLLAALLLNGCTFFFDVQDSEQPDPAPDSGQRKVILDEVHRITQSMKSAGVSEVSEVGPNEAQSGPEKWTVCSRINFGTEQRYYIFFLKGEKVVNWRPSVINDRCEARHFLPLERAR